jgi:hypothetical protein
MKSYSKVKAWKIDNYSPSEVILRFLQTESSITVFTKAIHWILYVMSQFHPISISTAYFCKVHYCIISASVLKQNATDLVQLLQCSAYEEA